MVKKGIMRPEYDQLKVCILLLTHLLQSGKTAKDKDFYFHGKNLHLPVKYTQR